MERSLENSVTNKKSSVVTTKEGDIQKPLKALILERNLENNIGNKKRAGDEMKETVDTKKQRQEQVMVQSSSKERLTEYF
ncbi:MAG: hypothetical protein C5B43_02655 [Verrucomicrobia bacterium]|nr:MAG: hypothetical protein C5B43_02655 [Verrucomicrobiota bacterium]